MMSIGKKEINLKTIPLDRKTVFLQDLLSILDSELNFARFYIITLIEKLERKT